MHPSHLTRSVGHCLAVWLSLWWVVMAGNLPPLPAGSQSDCTAVPGAARSGQADPHAAAHAPAGRHKATHCDEGLQAGGFEGDHAGHASGSLLHCPLCMHAAAPAPAFQPDAPGGAALSCFGFWPARAHFCARTTALPPARGPPAFS